MNHSVIGKIALALMALLCGIKVQANEQSQLLRIEQYVSNGNFKEAKDLAFGFDTTKLPKDMQLRYCQAQIRIAYAFEDNAEMRYWVRAYYKVSPTADLDPATFPPEAIDLLKQVKDENHAQQSKASESTQPPPKYISDKSFNLTLLPLGIGSFYQGRTWQGFMFLALHVTAFSIRPDEENSPDDELLIGSDGKGLVIHKSKFLTSSSEIGLFLGLWGHEVWQLLPELYAIDSGRAHAFESYLTYAPLGVAQLRNGHKTKGVTLAVLQGIAAGAFLSAREKRDAFEYGYAFLGLWLYSVIDGMTYYNPDHRTIAASPVQVSPYIEASAHSALGLGLQIAYDF